MTTLTDAEVEDIANIASRLSAENELAARRIAELEHENAQLAYDRRTAKVHALTLSGAVIVAALGAGIAIGFRVGSDGQWEAGHETACKEDFDAGRAVGRSEGPGCASQEP